MKLLKPAVLSVLFVALLLPGVVSASLLNDPDRPCQVRVCAEQGFVGVLSHRIQLGQTGTMFDYVAEGGQNNLLRFRRLSAELGIGGRHTLILLFQPLDLRTQALLSEDLVVDSLVFPSGTAMNLRYGFDFYRVSYLYDFLSRPDRELAIGASFQIRNATISFASQDGSLFRTAEDIGPVPVIKIRARWPVGERSWVGTEIDGFYATDRILNGASYKFEGSILDASVRYGLELGESVTAFVNWRFLGGGAKGQGSDPPGPGDGYTDNALATTSVTVGFYLR